MTGKKAGGATICIPSLVARLLAIALASSAVLLGVQSVLMAVGARQDVWKTSWVLAAVFMGPAVLHWPAVFDEGALIAATMAIYPISLVCVFVLFAVARRLNRRQSLLTGALFGLLLYFVDLHGLTRFFPWLGGERGWRALLSHLIFGAAAAWILARARPEPGD